MKAGWQFRVYYGGLKKRWWFRLGSSDRNVAKIIECCCKDKCLFYNKLQGDDDQASESCLFMATSVPIHFRKNFFLKMVVTYLDCPTIHSTTASLLFKNEELQHFSAINISFFILTLYLHTCCISSNTFINIENRAPPNKTPYFQMLIQLQFCVLSCPTCSKSSLYVLTPPFSYSPPVTHCILISLCTMMSALPSSVLHTAG